MTSHHNNKNYNISIVPNDYYKNILGHMSIIISSLVLDDNIQSTCTVFCPQHCAGNKTNQLIVLWLGSATSKLTKFPECWVWPVSYVRRKASVVLTLKESQ